MKPWAGINLFWGGMGRSRCEDELLRRWDQKALSPGLYISIAAACVTLASCPAETIIFLRFDHQSWKLGKTGWSWQKTEKSAVRVPFQGLSTNRVLLIFFWIPACSHSNTVLSCDQGKCCSLFVSEGLGNSFYELIISVATVDQSLKKWIKR